MDTLEAFDIPVSGLSRGVHTFNFEIDHQFFAHYPHSLIEEGVFEVQVVFTKELDHYELDFSYFGTIKTNCDRCLAAINFPISGNNQLLVKFAEETRDEVEILYVPIETERINIAPFIYEYISLAVPFVKKFDCESSPTPPCDEDMLKRLEESAEKENTGTNPVWDQLKNIKFN